MKKALIGLLIFSWNSAVFSQKVTELFPQYMELDKQGRYAEAAPILEQIVVAAEKEFGKDIMYFNVLIYTRDNYEKLRNYAKCGYFGERLDSIYAYKSPYSDDGLTNLSQTFADYTYAGMYGKAQFYAEKCLKEYERKFGKNSTDYGTALSNVGISYQAMGLHEKSLEYFYQALNIIKKTEPNSVQYFTTLSNVMTGEFLAGRKEKAAEISTDVLTLARELYVDYPVVVAHYIGNHATMLKNIGKNQSAGEYYTEALKIFEINDLRTNEIYADFLNNYSVFLWETGDLTMAKYASEWSLKIFTYYYGEKSHRTFFPKINLGLYNGIIGTGYSGISESTQALKQHLSQFKQNQWILSEKERIESRHFFDLVLGTLIGELIVKDVPLSADDKTSLYGDLFNLHINSKGMILSGINKTKNQILKSKNPDLIAKYHNWIQLKNQISFYNGLTLDSQKEAGVDMITLENQALSAEKELFTLAGISNQSDSQWTTWQQVQSKLKADEVVVEILRSEYKEQVSYLALILSKEMTNGPQLIKFADAKTLEVSGYKYYKNCIEYTIADQKSYDLYWKPISEAIQKIQPNNKRILLSTEGIYNLLSLNSLKDPQSDKYLVQQKQLRLLTNSQNLVVKQKLPSGADTWLIGDPDFQAPPISGTQRGTETRLASNMQFELAKLPGTFDEVTNIRNLIPAGQPVHVLTSKNANETAVKQIQSPKILHIASHGYFGQSDQAMLNTGIALSGLNSFYKNPASFSGDDGLLTSYEIQDMNLTGTDLVVLSACETGLGNAVTGEGVFGLQRAFRIAGAETLIMSLWKVDDQATQQLMTYFYKNQQTHSDLNEAFILAQNQLMTAYPHPKYWGAFLLVE